MVPFYRTENEYLLTFRYKVASCASISEIRLTKSSWYQPYICTLKVAKQFVTRLSSSWPHQFLQFLPATSCPNLSHHFIARESCTLTHLLFLGDLNARNLRALNMGNLHTPLHCKASSNNRMASFNSPLGYLEAPCSLCPPATRCRVSHRAIKLPFSNLLTLVIPLKISSRTQINLYHSKQTKRFCRPLHRGSHSVPDSPLHK